MRSTLTILFIFISFQLTAQTGITWQSPMNVAMGSFGNQHPRIVLDRSGDPMILWGKQSSKQLHFSRWNSAMGMFTTPVQINNSSTLAFAASWAGPDIASHGDTVYIVFKVTPEDTNHMFVSKSFDGGASFDAPVQIDFLVDSISRFPTISTDSTGNPVVGYMKFEAGFMNAQWAVMRSDDFGNSFNSDVNASGYSGGKVCDCCPGSLVISGNTAAMLYRDNLSDLRDMWAGISTDNCVSFPNGMNVDHTNWIVNACPSSGPDGVIIGDSLYTVYMSSATNTALTYLSRSSLTSMIAGSDERLSAMIPGLTVQNFPRISASGKKVAVVCKQSINGMEELPLFYSNDITASTLSQAYDTVATGNIENGDVAITDSIVHVVWEDLNTGTVRYRKGILPATPTYISNNSKTAFSIYPSPAKDFFRISSNENISSVEMFDQAGRNIKLTSFTTPNEVKCNFNCTPGVYTVKVNSNGTSRFARVVICE